MGLAVISSYSNQSRTEPWPPGQTLVSTEMENAKNGVKAEA